MIKNFRIPIILGSVAIIAIAVTVFILTRGDSVYGLSITEAYGAISVSNSQGSSSGGASTGTILKQGDILSVGDGASCTITYKSKKNTDDNYVVVNQNSQIVITDDFNGKNDGQIFLNRGSVLCNLKEKDKAQIMIRTNDSMVHTANTVSKVEYSTDEFDSFTDVYTFAGNSQIQLYDASGNKVNNAEILIEKRAGRVTTKDLGPEFVYLNVEFELDKLTASDLKSLLTIASFISDFPYTTAELKEAYDKAPEDKNRSDNDNKLPDDSSDNIQTAEPIVTDVPVDSETSQTSEKHYTVTQTPPTTTKPASTTAAPATTSSANNTSSANSNNLDDDYSENYYMVTVIVDGEESIQEVKHGQNAVKPANPSIDGFVFVGWDNSFDNITDDTIITALFESSDGSEDYNENSSNENNGNTHTVTLIIADKVTTMQVEDGMAADIPSSLTVDGYSFMGWDTDFSNVTSNITVTALLQPNEYIVNFVIEGYYYPITVKHGQTAVAPLIPSADSSGNLFLGWDKELTNVTSNMTVTAQFSSVNTTYTVVFVIEGVQYPTKVKNGETAIAPFIPTTNSSGQTFIGWDKGITNITSDMTVTAIFS